MSITTRSIPIFFKKALIIGSIIIGAGVIYYLRTDAQKVPNESAPISASSISTPIHPKLEAPTDNLSSSKTDTGTTTPVENHSQQEPQESQENITKPTSLPRLIELGSVHCIPCRMMAPILEQIKKEYGAYVNVEFHDVWQNKTVAEKYGVRAIPTQIILDSEGKELFRHIGFFPKEQLIQKLKELNLIP